MIHLVLWRLTSKSFCKDTNKVCNLQILAINLTLFYDVFFLALCFVENVAIRQMFVGKYHHLSITYRNDRQNSEQVWLYAVTLVFPVNHSLCR